ncbi:MAG TPA: protoporphyrinogen oxidase [Casimicrobiaceae bacterium]|nr:protoporphyrinogen oxidase [Casimicrobiaceae bacterium]
MSAGARHDADVVVIGGGLSGLAAAFGLKRRGASVEVLEAAPRPGGTIGTLRREGALYETGPNSALDTSPLIDALLEATGSRGERIEASPAAARRFIVRDGRLVALPASPPALLATRAFSLSAKLRLAAEPLIARAPADAEESVAAFVRRRLGTEFLDYAVDPFVAGVYAGDPERLSLPAAFPRLHALEQRYGSLIRGQIAGAGERKRNREKAKNVARSFSFRSGMQTLTDALARSLGRVETGVRVERVERDAAGDWVVSARRGGESIMRSARAAIVAVPAAEAAALVRDLAPTAAQGLAAIDYAAVASVATAYRRAEVADPLAGFGFLVPRRENRRILGSLFSSSMFENRAPSGTVLLTTFVGGLRNPDLARRPDDEIAAIVAAELRALVGARADPLWAAVTHWPRAIPQYDLGHRERLRGVDAAERALPGLYFCANYRGGISVGDCVKSADATATAAADFLRGRGSLDA